jgi:hypothetical protein
MSYKEQSSTKGYSLAEHCEMKVCSDVENGKLMDTKVTISGHFWIAGNTRDEFVEKLRNLIDQYEI